MERDQKWGRTEGGSMARRPFFARRKGHRAQLTWVTSKKKGQSKGARQGADLPKMAGAEEGSMARCQKTLGRYGKGKKGMAKEKNKKI